MTNRNEGLRAFAGGEVGSEPDGLGAGRAIVAPEQEGCAGVEMPKLGDVDPMPVTSLTAFQEIVDRARELSAVRAGNILERLAIMSAFRMRRQAKQPDDVVTG